MYGAVFRDFGGGFSEVGIGLRREAPRVNWNGCEKPQPWDVARAVRRAKVNLRRRIMAQEGDRLLTATYRRNEISFGVALLDLQRFTRAMRREFPGFSYVAVPERQKRGAWHWHIVVKGFYPVVVVRRLWLEICGQGNVDFTSPRTGGAWQRHKLAAYLGKYLGKGFESLDAVVKGRRRFFSTQHLQPYVEAGAFDSLEDAFAWFAGKAEFVVGYVWRSEDGTKGWACSWG